MRFTKTLQFNVSVVLVLIISALMGLLFYNNLYAINLVRNQVVQSYRELLPRYVEKQDDALAEIQSYLIRTLNHSAENTDIQQYNNSPKDSEAFFVSSSHLFLQLSKDIDAFPYADVLFVFSENNKSMISFSKSGVREFKDIDKTLKDMAHVASMTYVSSKWNIVPLGKNPGLLCMSTDGAGSYMGAWVSLHRLIDFETSNNQDAGRGMIVISGNRGTYLGTENLGSIDRLINSADNFFEGKPHTVMAPNSTLRYMLITEKSTMADLYFIEAIEERGLLSNLPVFQTMFIILPVVILIIFLIYFAYLQRIIVSPVHSITKGMQVIGAGNTKVVLPETGVEEFRYLIRTFNEMAAQIETLRIDVYENKLDVQQAELDAKKAELRYMQLQINPHFFANSLNIIYSLSAIRDYQTIQRMALLLSRYFRYVMNAGGALTELCNEISFVKDYLDIQKLRFTKKLTYDIQIDPKLENYLLPPLTLQPFVENAIVHGFMDPVNGLDIQIVVFESTDPAYFTVQIKDTGIGFSPDKLEAFRQPDFLKGQPSEHIGVWNVKSRLFMRYGEDATVQLQNNTDQGACVMVTLPKQKKI